MENEQLQPLQPTTTPLSPLNTPSMSVSPKPSQFPLAFLSLLSIIFLSVMTYFYFQIQSLKQQIVDKSSSISSSDVSPTPVSMNDPTSTWQTYSIKELGISFKYPPNLQPMDYPNGIETKGETGKQLCLSFIPLTTGFQIVKPVLAGGSACQGTLAIGSTSKDYDAGREGGFGDYQGYEKLGEAYKVKFVHGIQHEIATNLVKEITSPNGIKILRIKGASQELSINSGRGIVPVPGTPGEGYLGALININNLKYSGFNLQMKLSDTLTQEIFDQILSTIEITNSQ